MASRRCCVPTKPRSRSTLSPEQSKSPLPSVGAQSPQRTSPGLRHCSNSQPLPRRLALLQCSPNNPLPASQGAAQRAEGASHAACGTAAHPVSSSSPNQTSVQGGADAQQPLHTAEPEQSIPPCEPTQLQDEVLLATQVVVGTQVTACVPVQFCIAQPTELQAVLACSGGAQQPADGASTAAAPASTGAQQSCMAAAGAEQPPDAVTVSLADVALGRGLAAAAAASPEQRSGDPNLSAIIQRAGPECVVATEAAPSAGRHAPVASAGVGPVRALSEAPGALAEDDSHYRPDRDGHTLSQAAATAESPRKACHAAAGLHRRTEAMQLAAADVPGEGVIKGAHVDSQPEVVGCRASVIVSPTQALVYAELSTAPLLGQATPAAAANRAGCWAPGQPLTAPTMHVSRPDAASLGLSTVPVAARSDSCAAPGKRLSDAEVVELWRDTCENMDAGCEQSAVRYRTLTLDVSCAAKAYGVRLLDDPQVRMTARTPGVAVVCRLREVDIPAVPRTAVGAEGRPGHLLTG